MPTPPAHDLPRCDTTRRFVRPFVPDGPLADGLVAFEFSLGWPELAVELVLPAEAYAQFCQAHRVEHLPARGPDAEAEAEADAS